MALHRIRVALGLVVLSVGQRRLGHQRPQPGIVGRLGQVGQLLLGHGQVVPELAEPAGDLREATFDEGPGHRRAVYVGLPGAQTPMRDHARVLLPPSRRRSVSLVLLLITACGGGDDGAGPCGPITREALDSSYLVHVLADAEDVEYTSDPPTSGPHQPGLVGGGSLDEPLPRPRQVGILELGHVLLQFGPDLPAADLTALHALAAPGVVVAPNPDLPAPVVATAWTYKRTCDSVDVAALQEFIDERSGKGPDS